MQNTMWKHRQGARRRWLVLLWLAGVSVASAEVRLPHVFGSNMVLQRARPVPVWGWAAPGEHVEVTIAGHRARATADARGAWRVTLPAMPAGGPHEMIIRASNTIRLENVLAGEVWVCSGQSNMEMGIGLVDSAAREIAAADFPGIRLFEVPRRPAGLPQSDVDAAWRVCSPQTIVQGGWGGFSAVAYFFGRELHRELQVPIGLINTSWGGTRIEPWTPREGFANVPALRALQRQIAQADSIYRAALAAALPGMEQWLRDTRAALERGMPLSPPPDLPAHPLASHRQPTGLYNGMVHPLVPFALRGAIWYQGESNRGDGMQYFEKMRALISGWRTVWRQGDFPFYFVQLAPFRYGGDPHLLPEIWEAQTASLQIPNTGMAVTTDVSLLDNIHPTNKQVVGHRLALWALAKTYGRKDLKYSGPLFTSIRFEKNRAVLRFEHTGSGLISRDGQPLSWFEIAGDDEKFVPARAEISGDHALVWSDSVAAPLWVRFGWHQEAEPNLANREGLPASPFRTDRPLRIIASRSSAIRPEKITVALVGPPGTEVFFTLDGTAPTRKSRRYSQPLELHVDAVVAARAFDQGRPVSLTARQSFYFLDAQTNGLRYRYYEGAWSRLPDFSALKPAATGIAYDFDLGQISHRPDNFGLVFESILKLAKTGEYTFWLVSDDGSRLSIDGAVVANNDGLHGAREAAGAVRLTAGRHRLTVQFFEKAGGELLNLYFAGPGSEKQKLPPNLLLQK